MAQLKIDENLGGQTAVIKIDGAVAGGISQTGKGTFAADTSGRIPAVDGISGPSIRDAADRNVNKMRQGGVIYSAEVSVGPDNGNT